MMSLAMLFMGLLVIGILLVVGAVQSSRTRLRSMARNLLITYTMVVILLISGEAYYRYVYADSRMEFALTRDNWANRYVQKNSQGWRDREWTTEDLSQRQVIFVLGDSFTEGWGINDPQDRYTDVLARLLGDEYAVVNMGFRGLATLHQVNAVTNYPYQPPKIVIWQYFLNDIEVAAKSNGMAWDVNLPPIPPIVNESYLASFMFWRLNEQALYVNVNDGRSEMEFYYAAYDNPYIWGIHQTEIDEMLAYVERADARLITVIFPNMLDPVGSIPYVDRVAQYIEAKGYPEILKLFDQAAQWSLEARIVSNFDTHASVGFNQLVGELIYEQFFTPQS